MQLYLSIEILLSNKYTDVFSHFTEIQYTASQNSDNIDVTTRRFLFNFCKYKYSINLWSFPKNVLIRLYNCCLLSTVTLHWVTSDLLAIERLSITFTSNSKREFVPRDQVSPLLVVYGSLFIHINYFLSIRIALSCFYLLVFYFEKFSTWT